MPWRVTLGLAQGSFCLLLHSHFILQFTKALFLDFEESSFIKDGCGNDRISKRIKR